VADPEPARTAEEIRARVSETYWYHSIDLGQGVVTPGMSQSVPLAGPELPRFQGRSVLDIGAWDGFYSFQAERLGAARVVALDHYAWCVDIPARDAYWEECRRLGQVPDGSRDLTDFWRPDAPGRRGFDLAREILGSAVEPVLGDFSTMDLAPLGCFDVVLYLGVLYHVKDPVGVLERLRQTATEVAVIETEAVHLDGYGDARLMDFFPGDELRADYGNWFVPTEMALHALCRSAGFTKVETVRGHSFQNLRRKWGMPGLVPGIRHYRLAVHAWV